MKVTLEPADWARLGNQPVSRTALQWSRFVYWEKGAGEAEQAHPVSDQLILMAEGELELRTRGQQLRIVSGQITWVPRGCPHVLAAGVMGSRFWEIIAPNREPHQAEVSEGRRQRAEGRRERLEAVVLDLQTDVALPPSRDMGVTVVHLPPKTATSRQTLHEQERLWSCCAARSLLPCAI